MKSKRPHDLNAPGVTTQKVRKLYVGGKREEVALDGFVAQIGSDYELLGAAIPGGPQAEDYQRASNTFFLRYPDHPGHPVWQHMPKGSPWLAQLGTAENEGPTRIGYNIYLDALLSALKDWRFLNPMASPIHPDSVYWNPEWNALQFDPEPVWRARQKFLMAHEVDFRAAPGGLHAALWSQLRAFMSEHYAPVNGCDDERSRGKR